MFNSTKQSTFLFHDYETFGNNPSLDRPAQFAAIRTDTDLNILDDPKVFYCKLSDDYLPKPNAVLITGITPQEACAKGVHEAEFARRIHDLFSVPYTCVVGYNNLRFDDEITRNILYRNFYDPYAWSWKNYNSRWDLLDVMRACYALRPDGIKWSKNEAGLPSFRLEHLTRANGIEHHETHNAMDDVYATLSMARLVKENQPRLFNYLFKNRYKKELINLINITKMKPLVYISSTFGSWRGNTSWIVPLAWHPENRNVVIVADLAGDLTSLIDNTKSDVLHLEAFASRCNQEHKDIIPIKLVYLNQCPVLAQANVLRPADANRLGINRKKCLYNLGLLRKNPQICRKLKNFYTKFKLSRSYDDNDVDTQLYRGFFSTEDRAALNIILQAEPKNLPALNLTFTDQRIKKLIFNYRARNFPGTLDEAEQERWLQYRRNIFTPQFLFTYIEELERLFLQHEGDDKKQNLLRALWKYMQEIL